MYRGCERNYSLAYGVHRKSKSMSLLRIVTYMYIVQWYNSTQYHSSIWKGRSGNVQSMKALGSINCYTYTSYEEMNSKPNYFYPCIKK